MADTTYCLWLLINVSFLHNSTLLFPQSKLWQISSLPSTTPHWITTSLRSRICHIGCQYHVSAQTRSSGANGANSPPGSAFLLIYLVPSTRLLSSKYSPTIFLLASHQLSIKRYGNNSLRNISTWWVKYLPQLVPLTSDWNRWKTSTFESAVRFTSIAINTLLTP